MTHTKNIATRGKVTRTVKNIKNVTQNFYFVDKNSNNTTSQPQLKF